MLENVLVSLHLFLRNEERFYDTIGVIRGRTDNSMAYRKITKRQTIAYQMLR
jgi:hypothetical protein